MTAYRVYRLDGVSGKTSAEWIEAKSDEDAVTYIERNMGSTVKCEIWCENRVVKRLETPPLRSRRR